MAKIRITDNEVKQALDIRHLLDTEKEEWLTDTRTPGFQVRLSRGGKAFAYFIYWHGKASRKLSLGELGKAEDGKLTVEAARSKAVIAAGAVEAGGDPWADKKLQRDRLNAETFKDAWTAYSAPWSAEDRYRKETKALVEKAAIPRLGDRPLALIDRKEVAALIGDTRKRSVSRARALHAALRACFRWCTDPEREWLSRSPMEGLKAPDPAEERDRYLSEKEIAAFWRASGQMGFPWCHIYKLLLLTGTRRKEASALRWSELDGDVWTLPGGRVKNKAKHIVDLPPLALEIVNSVPKIVDSSGNLQDYVFSTTGTTPPSGFSKAKARFNGYMRKELGGLEPFWLHDLRRTIVTTLEEEFDYSEKVGERILNHKKKGIVRVYNKSTLRNKRKQALLEWSNYILALDKKDK
jgi:integrase